MKITMGLSAMGLTSIRGWGTTRDHTAKGGILGNMGFSSHSKQCLYTRDEVTIHDIYGGRRQYKHLYRTRP